MQRIHDEEHISTTPPPPPYTVVDQYNGANNVQYHTQNPYPATVITSDVDYRLAQKLQDEEYALWVDQNQHDYRTRPGEPPTAGTAAAAGTVIPHHCRPPMPPIPEHSPYNHHHHPCQGGNPQQYPVVYASPIQPPLPYSQTMPYASNNDICGEGQPYYGSMNQSYYSTTRSHPFYNVPHYNYQQVRHSYREEEEDSSSGCLTGFLTASLLCYMCSLCDE